MSLTSEIQQVQNETRQGWVECSTCHGTGNDTTHSYPDGSLAACKVCQGYGDKPRPTPETDAAWASWPYAGPGVHANFARNLERQRDEAREYGERCKQGCIKLSFAIDRIDYACGEPNEMEVSDYAIHQNEYRVVQRVKEKLESLRLLNWTPISEHLPTVEDANEFEDVEWSDGKDIWQSSYYLPNNKPHKATHWRRITLP